jgi:hypothetical protein
MGRIRPALKGASVPVLIVLAACLVPGVAHAGKANTDVTLNVAPADMGQYSYIVRVTSEKRRCKKKRTVVVWHDTNKNGKLDSGEYVIGQGKTNKRGKVVIRSSALPPVGDFIGVEVTGNDSCKPYEDSFQFGGLPSS